MQFETGNHVNTSGSCLQGYVDATYDEIVEKFGEPSYLDSYVGSEEDFEYTKVNVEWCICFEDGTLATIYNWKDFDGGRACRSGSKYHWHIGGKSKIAVAEV